LEMMLKAEEERQRAQQRIKGVYVCMNACMRA
jgi:hypothetical protein